MIWTDIYQGAARGEARTVRDGRMADLCVGVNQWGAWAEVVVPRRGGSTQPSAVTIAAHGFASLDAAKAWAESAAAWALKVSP